MAITQDTTNGFESPRERLRAKGLRVTAPRLAALDWLAGHPHSTAEQVAAGVRERLGAVSTQAVYDVLNTCTRANLIRRIEPAGHPARYETRTGDNHHHVVCRRCGRTEDVDCAVGAAPCLEPSHADGFAVDEAEVVFWGLCPDCLDRGARPCPPRTTTSGSPAR
jgi:Fur family ferric uptake transcriptional regulator